MNGTIKSEAFQISDDKKKTNEKKQYILLYSKFTIINKTFHQENKNKRKKESKTIDKHLKYWWRELVI